MKFLLFLFLASSAFASPFFNLLSSAPQSASYREVQTDGYEWTETNAYYTGWQLTDQWNFFATNELITVSTTNFDCRVHNNGLTEPEKDAIKFDGYVELYERGRIVYALEFDGSDDYVSVGNRDELMPVQAITVSAFINPKELSSFKWIVGTQSTASADDGYMLFLHNNRLRFSINRYNLQSATVDLSSDQINEWHHVVGVYDKINTKIYLNGVIGNNGTLTNDINYLAGSSLSLGRIGAISHYYWNGSIGDVLIYNRALSQEEITKIYNGGKVGTPVFEAYPLPSNSKLKSQRTPAPSNCFYDEVTKTYFENTGTGPLELIETGN